MNYSMKTHPQLSFLNDRPMGVRHRRASGPPVHQASVLHVPARSERFKDRRGGEFERRRRVTAIGYTDRVLANYNGLVVGRCNGITVAGTAVLNLQAELALVVTQNNCPPKPGHPLFPLV
jgi:hypothetical protein